MGCARKLSPDEDAKTPKTFYTRLQTHFGVKNPNKELVFYASAQVGCTSLNKWLLAGPIYKPAADKYTV